MTFYIFFYSFNPSIIYQDLLPLPNLLNFLLMFFYIFSLFLAPPLLKRFI